MKIKRGNRKHINLLCDIGDLAALLTDSDNEAWKRLVRW